jgi:hypothetical protein
MTGTQIFLLLCGAGQLFLVYAAVQFAREWKKARAVRLAVHCVRVNATEARASRQVIHITERPRRQNRQDARRIASRAS